MAMRSCAFLATFGPRPAPSRPVAIHRVQSSDSAGIVPRLRSRDYGDSALYLDSFGLLDAFNILRIEKCTVTVILSGRRSGR